MTQRLLLVDDDTRLAAMVEKVLRAAAYELDTASTLTSARALLERGVYDAVVLDLMLPDGDGLDLCRELRRHPQTSDIPLLIVSARGEAVDRILGLELGADDYLPKPFLPRELLARMKALLRRASRNFRESDKMCFGRLEIDPESREISIDGTRRDLSANQFDILLALARQAGKILSREQISDLVGGRAEDAFDRVIDTHVSRIRAAIEDDPKLPKRLLTVRGVGYVFTRKQDVERFR